MLDDAVPIGGSADVVGGKVETESESEGIEIKFSRWEQRDCRAEK